MTCPGSHGWGSASAQAGAECTYEVRTSQHRQEGVGCHLDARGFAPQRLSFGAAQASQNFRSS